MTKEEAINILKNAAFLSTKTSSQGIEEAVDMAIEALKAQDVTDINVRNNDLINRVDVEQTVEDNILCYTHSDRPIDQDPDTECHMAIRTALRMLRKDLRKLPSAQPETHEERTETHSCDYISRQALMKEFSDFVRASNNSDFAQTPTWNDAVSLVGSMPSAQPERLTDDDLETIRIHLNAYKEKLCNQRRWKEAKEYQRIIDRFMAFASAQPEQPEIIACGDCKHWICHDRRCGYWNHGVKPLDWCCHAERRTDDP